MNEEMDRARKDALAFLKAHKTGVLATSPHEGGVHASMVYYIADDAFNVYFLTLVNSRKFKALKEHPQIAFTVATPDVPQTLQMEGMATDITLDEDASKKKDELFQVLNSNPWFYAPITKLDPSETVIVWIRPTWIRWADYAFEQSGNTHVFKEIPLLG
jgi:general stress protein 26